jgi:hypothetical protein
MDPVIQPNRLYLWPGAEAAIDASADSSLMLLMEERLFARTLYQNQPEETRRFFERQAASIAEALLDSKSGLNFTLPEFVFLPEEKTGRYRPVEVPVDFRRHSVSGLLGRLPLKDARSAFRQRLSRLEESMYPAVAAGSGLLRYTVARNIVQERIPQMPDGEDRSELKTARLPVGPTDGGEGRGALEAIEQKVAERRRQIDTLHQALSLAPYIYTDEEYQSKRAAVLGRLIPLGRELSQLYVRRIIDTINRRAAADDLNRGLSLSLPYFDDRALEMKLHEFEVIPSGRTMFVPAFVALAARREQEALEQESDLDPSTLTHLLDELKNLERAFAPAAV